MFVPTRKVFIESFPLIIKKNTQFVKFLWIGIEMDPSRIWAESKIDPDVILGWWFMFMIEPLKPRSMRYIWVFINDNCFILFKFRCFTRLFIRQDRMIMSSLGASAGNICHIVLTNVFICFERYCCPQSKVSIIIVRYKISIIVVVYMRKIYDISFLQ